LADSFLKLNRNRLAEELYLAVRELEQLVG